MRTAKRFQNERLDLSFKTRSTPSAETTGNVTRPSVSWILKRAARRAGMKTRPLSGHSLRAGCVTQAAMNGANERDIMRQTGHKSRETLAKYIRIGQMFTHNAAASLGI